MAWRVAASLHMLYAQINVAAPGRSKRSDGTIGDAAHRSRKSDHNAWITDPPGPNVVSARDITDDDSAGADMRIVAEAIRQSRDPRVKYVIHEGRMYSSYPARGIHPFTWRSYSGSNQHFSHLHISVQPDKTLYDDTALWAIGIDSKEDLMKRGEKGHYVRWYQQAINGWRYSVGADPIKADGDFGAATEQAVRDYQTAAQLPVTGQIDVRMVGIIGKYHPDMHSPPLVRI